MCILRLSRNLVLYLIYPVYSHSHISKKIKSSKTFFASYKKGLFCNLSVTKISINIYQDYDHKWKVENYNINNTLKHYTVTVK